MFALIEKRVASVLGFIFGLNARLGRLHYFLATIGVAFLMTGMCFVMAQQAWQSAANGMPPSIDSLKGPAIVIGIIFMVITLTLQSMRIRDIGWDPVCVIPGWIAILIIDTMVAKKFPGLSLGSEHHSTAISAIVNLVLFLALLFWPSADYESLPPTLGEPRRPDPAPRSSINSVAAERLARASGEFGRRAV
ncbi:MAG TPA: hypothetical protein VGD75_15110 [Bradyrhizobium sp.]